LAIVTSLLLVLMAAGVLLAGTKRGEIIWRWLFFSVLVLASLAAIWLVARGLATRLRVAVEARKGGSEDLEGASHVLALLEQLGATPARGIERPIGPDVMALESALADIDGGVAKVVKSLFAGLTGWTPWRVSVDQDADGVVSVSISRNGKSRGAAVIAADVLDPRGTDIKPDPHVFVAAFVLTTLAKSHGDFEGLAGATDWVALGWQYVAATSEPALTDSEKAVKVLAPAVDRDPQNWLAQVDLASRRWRDATQVEDCAHYLSWLDWALANMPGKDFDLQRHTDLQMAPLRLRVLATRAAVAINHYYASKPANREPLISGLVGAITGFCQAVAQVADVSREKLPIDDAWFDGMKSRAAAMGAMLTPEQLKPAFAQGPVSQKALAEWRAAPRSPVGHYSWACTWATFETPTGAGALDPQKAISELRHAYSDPELVEWMGKDPQLEDFRNTAGFDDFRPKPRSALVAVEPFASRKTDLAASGLSNASLAGMPAAALQNWMPVTLDEATRLVEASRTVMSLTNMEATKGIALEVVALLEARGVVTRAALAQLGTGQRTELTTHLSKETQKFVAFAKRGSVEAALAGWLAAYAPPTGTTPAEQRKPRFLVSVRSVTRGWGKAKAGRR